MVGWHLRQQGIQHSDALCFRLAHCKPANCVAIKADITEAVQRCFTQVIVNTTLNDTEQRLTAIGSQLT